MTFFQKSVHFGLKMKFCDKFVKENRRKIIWNFFRTYLWENKIQEKKTSKLLNQYVAVTQVCSISGLIFGFRKKKLKGKKLKTQAKNSIFRHFFLNQKIKFSLNFLYANLTTSTLTIY